MHLWFLCANKDYFHRPAFQISSCQIWKFFFINLLNRSLNLQFAAATTTEVEASTAGPTSPTTVTPETTLTTGTEGGTIFLYIPLWNHDLFLRHNVLPKIHLVEYVYYFTCVLLPRLHVCPDSFLILIEFLNLVCSNWRSNTK